MTENKNSKIITTKKKVKEEIKKIYFNNKNKIYGIVNLSTNIDLENLIDGFKILPVNFVIIGNGKNFDNIKFVDNIDDIFLEGFDFIITNDILKDIKKYTLKGICPIINSNHKLKELFNDFIPLEGTGNSYSYIDGNIWSLFYNLSKYIENYNFPYDNKRLVENILLT